jgi:hypothetical protein
MFAGAAVFVESDETTILRGISSGCLRLSAPPADRRREHRGARIAL